MEGNPQCPHVLHLAPRCFNLLTAIVGGISSEHGMFLDQSWLLIYLIAVADAQDAGPHLAGLHSPGVMPASSPARHSGSSQTCASSLLPIDEASRGRDVTRPRSAAISVARIPDVKVRYFLLNDKEDPHCCVL